MSNESFGQVVWLVEMVVRNKSTNALSTLYLSSAPIQPFPPSDPDRPNQDYNPVVASPGQFGRFLYQKGTIDDSEARQDDSGPRLFNANQEFNDLRLNYAVDGRAIRIYRGRQGYEFWADYDLFFEGTMKKIFFALEKTNIPTVEIEVADKSENLNTDFQTTLYAGTNSGSTGVEGLPGDIKNNPKERSYGKVFNADVTPVNSSSLTYSLNAGNAIDSVTELRDNGAVIAANSTPDYADLAALLAASITAARFATCLAEGYVRLGSSPAGQITADFIGTKITNKALRSAEFDNASWTKNATTVTANSVAGPDGTTVADTITENSATSAHSVSQDVTVVSGKSHWGVVFLKAGTRSKVEVNLDGKAIGFDLSAGTTFATTIGGASAPTDSFIKESGNGWYRCGVKYTSADTTCTCTIALNNGTSASYAGNGTGSAYAWGFQLSQSEVPQSYVATTTAAASFTPVKSGEIIKAILDEKQYTYSTYSASDFTSINSAAAYDCGIFIREQRTSYDIVSEVANAIGAAWYHDRLGVFHMKLLGNPDSASGTVIVDSDIVNATRIQPRGDIGAYVAYQTILGYKKNYTIQDGDGLAGSTTATTRQEVALEYRQAASSVDTAVQADHLLSMPYMKDTLIYTAADAATEAARLQAIYSSQRDFISIEVDYNDDTSTLDLMDQITLTSVRAGYPSGKGAYIIGVSENDSRPGRRTLELFL